MRLLLAAIVLHNSFILSPALARDKQSRTLASTKVSLEARAVGEISNLTGRKFTVSDFLSKIQSQTQPQQFNFLREKAVGIKEGAFSVEKTGVQEFTVKTEAQIVRISIEDFEKGLFKINGRQTSLNVKAKPEVLWKEVSQALNLQTKTSLFQILFLEQAHAINWMGVLLGVAVVGVIGYMYNQSNCSQYDAYAAQCDLAQVSSSSVNTADLYYNARSFDDSWFNLSLGCSASKEKVRSCIPNLANTINGNSTTATVQ